MTNRSSIQATSSQSLLDSLICNEILEEEENEEIIFDESDNLGEERNSSCKRKSKTIPDGENSKMKSEHAAKSEIGNDLNGMDINRTLYSLEIIERKISNSKTLSYRFKNGRRAEIQSELVLSYQDSLFWGVLLDKSSRTENGEIYIDEELNSLNEMIKYMNRELNIWSLNDMKFKSFCEEMVRMGVTFREDIMTRIRKEWW